MKKYILDLVVATAEHVSERHTLLKLTHSRKLPAMQPGQFVEVRVDGSPTTFLRRPISISFVDEKANELWLLIAAVGEGTRRLASLRQGDELNCVLPLGRGFTMTDEAGTRCLLVGGGVGVAPLLYLGRCLLAAGNEPTFLLGARTKTDLLMLREFETTGRVLLTTDDGSCGEKGFVTQHSALQSEAFDFVYSCGPKPMMLSVARYAKKAGTPCEVSLENTMACGLGACLCCVEPTVKGNLCVCKDGPVFNINELTWQI